MFQSYATMWMTIYLSHQSNQQGITLSQQHPTNNDDVAFHRYRLSTTAVLSNIYRNVFFNRHSVLHFSQKLQADSCYRRPTPFTSSQQRTKRALV
jgi:hypothetical protein